MELRQTYKPSVTQEMLRSLNILRMPAPELSQYVSEVIRENPVLDIGALNETENPPVTEAMDAPQSEDGESVWEEIEYRDTWESRSGDASAAINQMYAGITFAEMLAEQINTGVGDQGFHSLCMYIVGCLNKRGYLDSSVEEIAHETGVSEFDVNQALYYIQSLQPTGVGARNLCECLLLQLAESREFNEYTVRLITAGLPLLAERNTAAIQKLLRCDTETAARCMRIVSNLNPIPAQGFDTGEQSAAIIPDVIIQSEDGEISVAMNERYLPKIRINNIYSSLPSLDKETRKYLSQKTKEARMLISAVEEREKTLTLIVRVILDKQRDFFKNAGALEPMTQAEIGELVGLHASTVSRAIRGKYIQLPFGTIEMKQFFSSAVPHTAGGKVSSAAVMQHLRHLIQKEDPKHPLSDESICDVLSTMGINVARRTVAKYRAGIGIQSAAKRRSRQG
jgi:RNA polymerase sigma-54 factor